MTSTNLGMNTNKISIIITILTSLITRMKVSKIEISILASTNWVERLTQTGISTIQLAKKMATWVLSEMEISFQMKI